WTATGEMFRTIWPSLTKFCGTRTPGSKALTRMYGVQLFSSIHSFSARTRYGRCELMDMAQPRTASGAHLAFLLGEAGLYRFAGKQARAVVEQRLRRFR